MKQKLKDFHHYKGNNLSRSEKVERKVIQLILTSRLNDSKRENSIVWELKHSSGCCQIARVLAQKRNLDIEIAETIAVLHDIYAITKGRYKDHAKLGAPVARKILVSLGGFSTKEINTIIEAVKHHSEKDLYTDKPYVELIKDVDVFDCSLYKNSEDYYLIHKPEKIAKEYKNRVKKVREELGLSLVNLFRKNK